MAKKVEPTERFRVMVIGTCAKSIGLLEDETNIDAWVPKSLIEDLRYEEREQMLGYKTKYVQWATVEIPIWKAKELGWLEDSNES